MIRQDVPKRMHLSCAIPRANQQLIWIETLWSGCGDGLDGEISWFTPIRTFQMQQGGLEAHRDPFGNGEVDIQRDRPAGSIMVSSPVEVHTLGRFNQHAGLEAGNAVERFILPLAKGFIGGKTCRHAGRDKQCSQNDET